MSPTTRQTQLLTTAITLWNSYLERAIAYPRFAHPERFETAFDFKAQTFDGSQEEFERYEWFVSSLLRTGNEILTSYDSSDARCDMVKRNIAYHRRYIQWRAHEANSPGFFDNLDDPVKQIVRDIAGRIPGKYPSTIPMRRGRPAHGLLKPALLLIGAILGLLVGVTAARALPNIPTSSPSTFP